MRPTRLGAAAAAMAAFTLFAAGSTGNNLLYMLFAATVSALAVCAAAGRLNLRGLNARLEAPAQAFRLSPFAARIIMENPTAGFARLVRAVGPLGASEPVDIPAGGAAGAELRLALAQRGLNSVDGLVLETLYPFGFFAQRRRIPAAEVLVLPQSSPFRPQGMLEADPRAAGPGARRKERGGEFFGPRPYTPDDDARAIHWKLTARSGRPVVAEYAAAPQGQAVVRLEGTDEASVERAASACRWYVDSGMETGLAGPGVEVAPARGLSQLDVLLRALALVGDGARARRAPSAPKAKDLGPADSVAVRRLTLFGGALVFAAMFLIDDLNPRTLLLFAPLLPIGVWLHERGGPFPPKRLWDLCSAGLLVYLLLIDWRRAGVALANAHLLGYLLVNRLFNPWSREELRQAFLILYLAFFLVSGLTISPWYFPLFVAWLGFAGAWLMLQSGARPERARTWLPSLGRVLLAGAAVGAGAFIAVPRVEGLRRFNPFVASGMDKLAVRSQSVTGFTDRVSLGHFGTLRRSSARVMRVKPESVPNPGAAPGLYVRGAAFDRFDGKQWDKTALDFRWRDGGKRAATERGRAWARRAGSSISFPAPPGPGTFYDFDVYPMQVSALFTVGAPRIVEGAPSDAWFDHTDSLYLSAPSSRSVQYREYTAPSGRFPTDAALDLGEAARARALQTLPDAGGREAALAARWTKGLTDPAAKAEAVVFHLQREYGYSTYSDGRRTGLADFLFDVRKGNCEYFATAAAVLMRRAGVPARLVTGFHASDWNEWGRFYDVRQSQAHAWVEAYIPGRGWTVYDATPAESGLSAAAEEFSRRLQRWVDAAQTRWYSSVIGYDQYAQRDAFLRLSFGRLLDAARDRLLGWIKAALPLVLGLGLLYWLVRAVPAALRRGDEYERAERALARAGIARRPSQTPREFARRLTAERPDLGALEELAELHYLRRYAGRAPDAAARRRAAALLAQLRARL